MTRPHIEPFCERVEEYRAFTLPGFPKGSHYKILSLDRDTGACSLKMRFDAGYARAPGMSYSDMEFFILQGQLKVGDKVYGPGHYVFLPAGVALGALSSEQGCEALMFYNEGEPTFVESDSSHRLAIQQAAVDLNAYDDMPWIGTARKSPGVATGCLVKLLRFDPFTKATTFLYSMTAEFSQDNISYHDCAEESFHIWGTSWMLQFGDLPTGGYFWRPPYINHGAFASRQGCIALGRTDAELFNYFHFNPWTTPEENHARAAAKMYRERPDLWKWVVSEGHNHPHGPEDFEHGDYHDQVKHLHRDHDHDH